ncbi:MAG: PIN domain-containing protein [Thermoplasmatota archaeon]|nr:PIN domain-containing protein [Halobacteriales archaeon]
MIADTCLLIDALRGERAASAFMRDLQSQGAFMAIPSIALFELWEGVERADRSLEQQRMVEELAESYPVLAFESRHAQRAGRLSGELVRRGEMLDAVDAQIAGMALVEGLAVVTRNRKDFERVPGLKVVPY